MPVAVVWMVYATTKPNWPLLPATVVAVLTLQPVAPVASEHNGVALSGNPSKFESL